MLTLPDAIVPILAPFATLFTNPAWQKARLLVGAILVTGQRTVAAAFRVMGGSDQDDYARYHEVLNLAAWSSREAALILLLLLLRYLDRGDGPLVFGIDETLERRRGAQIRARGIYLDAIRSSRQQLVKARRSALDLPDVVGTGALGRSVLGVADAHRAGAFIAVLPAAGTPAQEDHRLGPADSCCCVAGCPTGPCCWWGAMATPSSICSAAASPCVSRSL